MDKLGWRDVIWDLNLNVRVLINLENLVIGYVQMVIKLLKVDVNVYLIRDVLI